VTPSSKSCQAGVTNNFDFLVTGGTGEFNAILDPAVSQPTVTDGVIHVTIPSASATGTITLRVSSGDQIKNVTITCQ